MAGSSYDDGILPFYEGSKGAVPLAQVCNVPSNRQVKDTQQVLSRRRTVCWLAESGFCSLQLDS